MGDEGRRARMREGRRRVDVSISCRQDQRGGVRRAEMREEGDNTPIAAGSMGVMCGGGGGGKDRHARMGALRGGGLCQCTAQGRMQG
eukprot:363348-Chlamydomonas_euryale.AAC.16